jgi:hypothetical protein
MNNLGGSAHWLGLRLLTGKPGRDALGARVEILRPGQPTLWRRARADGSYASANDPRVLAGLAGRAVVSGVVVHWPSGRIEAFAAGAVKVDAYTTLREGTGNARPGTGGTRPGTGNTRPGAGNARPGTGSARPGTGNTRPGAGNARPGTASARP